MTSLEWIVASLTFCEQTALVADPVVILVDYLKHEIWCELNQSKTILWKCLVLVHVSPLLRRCHPGQV